MKKHHYNDWAKLTNKVNNANVIVKSNKDKLFVDDADKSYFLAIQTPCVRRSVLWNVRIKM